MGSIYVDTNLVGLIPGPLGYYHAIPGATGATGATGAPGTAAAAFLGS